MPRWVTWREDLVLLAGLAGTGYELVVDHLAHAETAMPVLGAMVLQKITIGRDKRKYPTPSDKSRRR